MQKSDLKGVEAFEAQTYLIEQLCHSHYKGDGSELDNRIEKLWRELRGTTYRPRDSVCISLVGGPQTAKTFSFRQAAKVFSEAVGLTFIDSPDDKIIAELNKNKQLKNCFLFVCKEFAGEMSAMTTTGLPVAGEMGDKKVMQTLPLMVFAALNESGGGLLLLDDFANAIPNVRNSLLPLLQFKRAGSLNLEGKYVGCTRNRGSLDGTHTSKTSAAEVSRGMQLELSNSVDSWLEYALPYYKGTPTELILETFMLNHGHEHFYRPPNKHGDANWPGSRTWELSVKQNHNEFLDAAELIAAGRPIDHIFKRIDDFSGGLVGIETGAVFSAHVRTWLKGALPCALSQMKNGELDGEMRRVFDGYIVDKANTPNAAEFATNYVFALASEASNMVVEKLETGKDIVKDKAEYQDILQRFVDGVYNYGLHEDKMALAMTKFKDILVETAQSKQVVGRVNDDGMTVMNDKFLQVMTEVVGRNHVARMPHPELKDVRLYDVTFTDVVSNASKMERDFERVTSKKVASEYAKAISGLKDLAEETPTFEEMRKGEVDTTPPVDLDSSASEIEESLIKEADKAKANEKEQDAKADATNPVESEDDFALEQEKDWVEKPSADDIDISDDDMDELNDALDAAFDDDSLFKAS